MVTDPDMALQRSLGSFVTMVLDENTGHSVVTEAMGINADPICCKAMGLDMPPTAAWALMSSCPPVAAQATHINVTLVAWPSDTKMPQVADQTMLTPMALVATRVMDVNTDPSY
ncbi:hypothetical protein STEG23_029006 [Scotinomys teguina]